LAIFLQRSAINRHSSIGSERPQSTTATRPSAITIVLIDIIPTHTIPAVATDRLKPSWYYILLSLAAADRHGLGVAREVLALSDGQVRLWPASLYGALEDLCDRGWIEELTDPRRRPPDDSERKRFYRITRAGRAAAATETERLAALVRIARSRVKPRTGETS
jgi:DNA-binding PadR family transcriptional regulator